MGRFPDAVQAWLAGSVTTGRATATSDLDVTVVLPGVDPALVHRESLVHDGWPVELFVQNEESVAAFVAQDLARRRPTLARLVGRGLPLLPGDGGARLVADCRRVLDAGPPPLTAAQLDLARYGLTDLLDDLADDRPAPEAAAVAVEVWRATAELALAAAGAWSGSGKWLVRELSDRDPVLVVRLDDGLRQALAGDVESLVAAADDLLDRCGGRLWAGFRLQADPGRT
jgi:hypothetical protein